MQHARDAGGQRTRRSLTAALSTSGFDERVTGPDATEVQAVTMSVVSTSGLHAWCRRGCRAQGVAGTDRVVGRVVRSASMSASISVAERCPRVGGALAQCRCHSISVSASRSRGWLCFSSLDPAWLSSIGVSRNPQARRRRSAVGGGITQFIDGNSIFS